MNKSKEMKEKYEVYMKEELKKSTGAIISYRKWLRENK
jgi:hypothetical protein